MDYLFYAINCNEMSCLTEEALVDLDLCGLPKCKPVIRSSRPDQSVIITDRARTSLSPCGGLQQHPSVALLADPKKQADMRQSVFGSNFANMVTLYSRAHSILCTTISSAHGNCGVFVDLAREARSKSSPLIGRTGNAAGMLQYLILKLKCDV